MKTVKIGTTVLAPSAVFTKKEWRLFDALWQCKGSMVTREYLFLCVYHDPRSRPANVRSIDVLACRVRKKLSLLFNGENCIDKVSKEGYKFRVPNYC